VQVWRPKNLHPVQLGNSGPAGPAALRCRPWDRRQRGPGGARLAAERRGPVALPGRPERRCVAGRGGAVRPVG
jgi:hypothetical protein